MESALQRLAELGASPHLVRHHELVLEAATLLVTAWCEVVPGVAFDERQVLQGAALHDAGKIRFPEELAVPGHRHEEAGEALLLEAGVAPDVARHCVLHASWADHTDDIEVLLVALADKLWKGKRVPELEEALVRVALERSEESEWEVRMRLDDVFERVAEGGQERLARSVV